MHAQFTNIAVIGASGAIGGACARRLAECCPSARVHAFARDAELSIDYDDEASIASAADLSAQAGPLDLVLVATGMLHSDTTLPEKSLRDLSAGQFARIFAANTITPALIAKHFLPKLNREHPAVFAAILARVGSSSRQARPSVAAIYPRSRTLASSRAEILSIADFPCAARNAYINLNMLRFLRCYSLRFIHHSRVSQRLLHLGSKDFLISE